MQHRTDVKFLVLIFDVRLTLKPKTAFWWIYYLTKQRKHEDLQLPAKTLMLKQKPWYLLTPQGAIPC